MSVRRRIPEFDGIYFITITCTQWLHLFEKADGYAAVYQWLLSRYMGVAVNLTGGTATSIAVSGNDVYVASGDNWYWKNGTEVNLNSAGYAFSIFVAK